MLNFRRIPYRLLADEEASIIDITTYIAASKNINFDTGKVTITRTELSKLVGTNVDYVRQSMLFLQRKAYVYFIKDEDKKLYTTTVEQVQTDFVPYPYKLYDQINGVTSVIYAKLLMYGGQDKVIYTKITALAEKLGVNFRRLKTALKELQEKGLISYREDGCILITKLSEASTPQTEPSPPAPPASKLFVAPTPTPSTPTAEKPIEAFNKADWAKYFKKSRGCNYYTQQNDGSILMDICNEVGSEKLKKVIDLFVNSNVPDQYKTPFYMERSHVTKILQAIDAGATAYDQNAKYVVPEAVVVGEEVAKEGKQPDQPVQPINEVDTNDVEEFKKKLAKRKQF